MPDAISATTAPAALPSGTAPVGGQAASAAPATPAGEPRPMSADQPGEPESKPEPKRLWQDFDAAERDYKALQSQYTKLTQGLAHLGVRDFGELQTRLELLEHLSATPEFIDWAHGQIAKATAGSDDPETQKALEIIDARAREIAAEEVAPLKAQAVQAKVVNAFAAMDKKYGPAWQALKPQMFERLQELKARGLVSANVETNFDLSFVEDLFLSAAGRDPSFAAKQHEKRLSEKRAVATEAEGGAASGQVSPGRAKTMEEAWANAKKAHGVA